MSDGLGMTGGSTIPVAPECIVAKPPVVAPSGRGCHLSGSGTRSSGTCGSRTRRGSGPGLVERGTGRRVLERASPSFGMIGTSGGGVGGACSGEYSGIGIMMGRSSASGEACGSGSTRLRPREVAGGTDAIRGEDGGGGSNRCCWGGGCASNRGCGGGGSNRGWGVGGSNRGWDAGGSNRGGGGPAGSDRCDGTSKADGTSKRAEGSSAAARARRPRRLVGGGANVGGGLKGAGVSNAAGGSNVAGGVAASGGVRCGANRAGDSSSWTRSDRVCRSSSDGRYPASQSSPSSGSGCREESCRRRRRGSFPYVMSHRVSDAGRSGPSLPR
jgi:hypothetical protein